MYGQPNFPFNQYMPSPWGGQQPSSQSAPQSGVQPQTLQTVSRKSEPQVMCYAVKSPNDLAGFNLLADMMYIGINQADKEVYIRKMDDKGIAEVETYKRTAESQEKSELQIISDRLSAIEKVLIKDIPNADTTTNSATAS
ncbi:MAG: hypothetical protein IJ184_03145 [Alphaproteobacteria bacterium]|nr:hypothetical protein [Alphaproteobacteria bacterium]